MGRYRPTSPSEVKVAAPIIAKPIADLFNLSLHSGEVPIAWKAATVRPLFKGRDQADPNCCRPISILPCLSSLVKNLIIINLAFLMSIVFSLVCNLVMMSPLPLNLGNVVLLFLLTRPKLLIR